MTSESIVNPLKGQSPSYTRTKPNNARHEGVYWEKHKPHID